jgi:hypothetical protein
MSGTTYNGIQYATGGDAATIHTISANLANTANPWVIGSAADTTTRDANYSADITAGKVGMKCWIVNRSGHCTYTGASFGWRWEPQRNVLINATRPSAANSAGNVGQSIMLMAPVTLPPNNRWIEVTIKSDVQNLTSVPGIARIYDGNSNTGISEYCPGNAGVVLAHTFPLLVRTGTYSFNLFGHDPLNVTNLSFTNSYLQICDLGPTDS